MAIFGERRSFGAALRDGLQKNTLGSLGRFIIVGLSNTALSFCIFSILITLFGTTAIVVGAAQAIAYAAGTVWSYTINRNWSFKSKGSKKKEFLKFVILQLSLLVATSVAIPLLVNHLEISPLYAWFYVMAIATVANFIVSKFMVFK